jgi:hypothetical protein
MCSGTDVPIASVLIPPASSSDLLFAVKLVAARLIAIHSSTSGKAER